MRRMLRGVLFTMAVIVSPSILLAGLTLNGVTVNGLSVSTTAPLPEKLMPLGDSITRGSLDTPVIFGYRDHLQVLLGVGEYDFVGPYTDPDSDATYDVDHNGVGGDDTLNILARIESNLDTYMPTPNNTNNAVLLMIGTNDIKDGFVEATTVDNVEEIIDIIVAHDPTIKIYVATIIPSTNSTWNTNFTSYNSALVTRLTTLMGSNPNLHRVDMNAAFRTCNSGTYTACLADSLHPNDAGYQVIANTWYSCMTDSDNEYCDGN